MKKTSTWDWLPDNMRAAVAASGLFDPSSDGLRVGTARGNAWATDGRFMITIGDAAGFLEVRRKLRLRFRQIDSDKIEFRLVECSRGYRNAAPPSSVEEAGFLDHDEWPGVALGKVVLSRPMHELARALWPEGRWLVKGRYDPIFLKADGAIVAVMMPMICGCIPRAAKGAA